MDQHWRIRGCGYRILSSLIFTESARHAEQHSKSHLLASIGNYYSAFHISLATLYLCEGVSPTDLKHIKHKTLRDLVMRELIQSGLLDKRFHDILDELRVERETNNYEMPIPYELILSEPDAGYDRVREMFALAVPLIRQRADNIPSYDFSLLQREIGDGFGDDLIDQYCGEEVWEAVTNRLLEYDLTT